MEGPDFFAGQWRSAAPDSGALRQLVFGSSRIRDNRLLATASSIARDRSRPDLVRAAAMILLSKYVAPGNPLVLQNLVPRDSISRIPLFAGGAVETTWVSEGADPLPPTFAADVLALLRSLAADRASESRTVWYAAAVVARRVESDLAH